MMADTDKVVEEMEAEMVVKGSRELINFTINLQGQRAQAEIIGMEEEMTDLEDEPKSFD